MIDILGFDWRLGAAECDLFSVLRGAAEVVFHDFLSEDDVSLML